MANIGKFRSHPYDPDLCPRCLGPLPVGYPGALSRVDNKTEVCSACGLDEAIRFLAPIDLWPIEHVPPLPYEVRKHA